MTNYAFTLTGVDKYYDGCEQRVQIFDQLDMQIRAGDFCAIVGPSGSGKTTLLNILGGIDSVSAGQLLFGDQRIDNLDEEQLTAWRAQHIGFIFQQYNLISILTAQQNVELPLLLTRMDAQQRARKVAAALALVGLSARASHRPHQLSGGQQQRVAIARAIVADLPVLLCDEPTGNLDRDTSNEILDILSLLNEEQGKTIVMVTHDAHALGFAKTTYQLDKGRFAEADAHG
jgi:putative ABC transport system ATP-binding protein